MLQKSKIAIEIILIYPIYRPGWGGIDTCNSILYFGYAQHKSLSAPAGDYNL
jgi:hypothetical protein